MAQISKGDTFVDGQQVTGARLNQLVDSSVLLVGAITGQPSITANTLEATDSTIVNDAGTLKEATIGDILNSNLPITTSSINGGAGVDVTVTPAAGQKTNIVGNLQVSGNLTVTGTSTIIPAGCVMSFAMNTAPSGWLKCDGSLVSRTTYAVLFTAIGTTFGAGDGSTTFKLPDLRGEFIRGFDDARGVDAGRAFGSSQSDEFKSHKHTWNFFNGSSVQSGNIATNTALQTNTGSIDRDTGLTGGTETRPRNIALLYAIKT
jgi:microcystin-dependent protein